MLNYPRGSGKTVSAGEHKTVSAGEYDLEKYDLEIVPDAKVARKNRHLEAAEQITLMDQVRLCLDENNKAKPHRAGADLIFALTNESAAGDKVRQTRWKMGVKAGLPDIGVFVPRGGYHGAFIEMKQSGGVASDVRKTQRECQEGLNRAGYKSVVCFGWYDGWKFLCDYLDWEQN